MEARSPWKNIFKMLRIIVNLLWSKKTHKWSFKKYHLQMQVRKFTNKRSTIKEVLKDVFQEKGETPQEVKILKLNMYNTCGRLSNSSQRYPCSNPLNPVNVTLQSKRNFAEVMQLRILKWGRVSWIIQVAPDVITNVLQDRGRGRF